MIIARALVNFQKLIGAGHQILALNQQGHWW
jgi:hypothetical protein